MQVPIVSGIYTDENSDVRTSYPKNMVPIPKAQGVSNGYLRPADGIELLGTGPGTDRGAINWNGVCYRAMGSKLVSVDVNGVVTTLGDIGDDGKQVGFDYSFDRLAIASANKLYYWDGSTLTEVTDTDLGKVLDVIWVDGYFMTTDGEFLVVTELDDPTQVNPLKYGSSEVDPDDIKAVIKVRNEPHALNRYTIEAFDNIGGDLFPFQRIEGAQLQKGTIGTHSCCRYLDALAFLGGGRNEAPAVWLGLNGQTQKLSTREIDQLISEYTEVQLESVVLEHRKFENLDHLYVRLPDKTLIYDAMASAEIKQPVWFILESGITATRETGQYRAINPVYCYDKWIVGDPQSSNVGVYVDSVSSQWGELCEWEFTTGMVYNAGNSAIFHELELVALPGRAAFGDESTIWTSYSLDGIQYSALESIKAGKLGERMKRLVWWRQGTIRNWRTQRFNGTSDAHMSFLRLEVQIEPLAI